MEQETLLSLVQELFCLQEERVYTYDLFNEGHKIYLCTSPNYDLAKFKALLLDVTQELKRISVSATRIEAMLRPHYYELANLIHSLEEDEKRNLELIARLQLAKQDLKDHPSDGKRVSAVSSLKQQVRMSEKRIRQVVSAIRSARRAEADL